MSNSSSNEHFTPLTDAEVPERHRATLAKYRTLAQEHGVPETTPLVWRVRSGFTLKHAPKCGPCFEEFEYLQSRYLKDEPTKDGLVFWVPRLLDEWSTSLSPDHQLELLVGTRRRLKLPSHHLTSFGSVALLAGLILAHLRTGGERVPVGVCATRTDTCLADGRRLLLRWERGGLYCSSWYPWGLNLVGVYALGVENDS